jgi:hypothetical protein
MPGRGPEGQPGARGGQVVDTSPVTPSNKNVLAQRMRRTVPFVPPGTGTQLTEYFPVKLIPRNPSTAGSSTGRQESAPTEKPNLPAVIDVRTTPIGIDGTVEVTRDEVRAAQDELRKRAQEDLVTYRRAMWRKAREKNPVQQEQPVTALPTHDSNRRNHRQPPDRASDIVNVIPMEGDHPLADVVFRRGAGPDTPEKKVRYIKGRRR